MAKAAFWFGLLGLAAGELSCIAMLLITVLAMFFVPVSVWYFLAYIGLFFVTCLGFAGAVEAEKRPGRAAVMMFVAALPWALASVWVMSESAVMITLPATVLFALGSLLGWLEHWHRQDPTIARSAVD